MIRVFICSDVRIYREGVAEVLGQRSGIAVVGTSAGEAERFDDIRRLATDVVLLDMSTPSSVALLRELAERAPEARVVALGVSETEPEIVACAEAGVAGYVTRDQAIGDLVDALVAVARGEAPCSPKAAAILLHRVSVLAGANGGGRRPRAASVSLTERERQILGLIRGGLSNKQIGQQLCIELPTVKNHVHNILEKLDVRGRHEAAAVARELTTS
jgi:DNA-binding NarL/FixJ family response regulator